jgi:hypothetical protein
MSGTSHAELRNLWPVWFLACCQEESIAIMICLISSCELHDAWLWNIKSARVTFNRYYLPKSTNTTFSRQFMNMLTGFVGKAVVSSWLWNILRCKRLMLWITDKFKRTNVDKS